MKQHFYLRQFRLSWVGLAALALGLLTATTEAQAQAPATFTGVVTYSTGGSTFPASVAVGDVNGDGKPDLLTANSGASTVGVLLGNGSGGFTLQANSPSTGVNNYPSSVLVADVNGDGKLDVLTLHSNNNNIGVLLGTGNGTFGSVTTYSTGARSRPASVAVADVNGDGKLDLLTSNFSTYSVGVLLGTGTGTFGTAATYSTVFGINLYGIAVGDMNGDGKLDVLTSNGNNTVGVLLGTGTGAFGATTTYATGPYTNPVGITVGDVNLDGKLDLITANKGNGTAGVLLGTGTGTLGGITTYSTGANSNPQEIAVADVNGDGKPDLVTANNYGSDNVGVLLGAGTGTFGNVTTYSIGAYSAPQGLAVADVNGDGLPDVFTANNSTSTVGVLLNTTYAAPTLTSLNPTSGQVGTSVTLTGTKLTGATGVSFNGTAATTFAAVNATTV